jgi:transmembrane sensor
LSQSNFDRLLQKYLSGQCTEEEEKIVLEWYHTLIANSDLHLSDTQKAAIEARLWNRIRTNVTMGEESLAEAKVVPITARTWFRVAAAACVLALVVTIIVLNRPHTNSSPQGPLAFVQAGYDSLVNETTTEKKLVLADSSSITLQPGTRIYYPPVFTNATRDVYLTGSAFFKVHHDPLKHFRVHMNNSLTTEVLGTSFNIVQHKTSDNIVVAVVTGKVRVYKQEDTSKKDNSAGIILTRNKKVTYNAVLSRFTAGIVDNPQPLPPPANNTEHKEIKDALSFEEETLQAVLQTLSNVYGISIVPENEQLAAYHFTGNLSGYSLSAQLDYICKSTQTTYEINGTQIVIKQNQNR